MNGIGLTVILPPPWASIKVLVAEPKPQHLSMEAHLSPARRRLVSAVILSPIPYRVNLAALEALILFFQGFLLLIHIPPEILFREHQRLWDRRLLAWDLRQALIRGHGELAALTVIL